MRWGIVATGTIAKNFAETVKQMGDEAQIAAVCSRCMANAEAFADAYGIAARYDSVQKLAADPNVDLVYVASPHNAHAEQMKILLEAGKPVLCEKSFTTDARQAKELFALAQEKGVFLMEAFWTKFIPLYRTIERWIAEGKIGEIRAVTAQYGYQTAREARKFEPAMAGGTLLDIGVYAVGFACMMMGYSFDSVLSQLVMNDVGTDATDAILLRKGNAVAQLTCAIGANIPLFGAVYGTKGRIEVPEFKNPQKATLFVDGEEPVVVEHAFDVNGFEYEIREAMRCMREGLTESPMMTGAQSIAVMEIMDEVRRQNGLRFPFEAQE